MWKSGGIRSSAPAPPNLPPPDQSYRLRGPLRLVLVLGVLFIVVVCIFPLIFKPIASPPTELQVGGPFSMKVQISNQNATPLTDVEYTCEGSKLTMANGVDLVPNTRVLTRGTIRKIPGRTAILARCDSSYLVNAPLKAAEYKLMLWYKAYPWPQLRTVVYRIAAVINEKGDITKWKIN